MAVQTGSLLNHAHLYYIILPADNKNIGNHVRESLDKATGTSIIKKYALNVIAVQKNSRTCLSIDTLRIL